MLSEDSLEWARAQDASDELLPLRAEFLFPDSGPLYFAGHSLGLQPRRAREYVLQELDDWARLGVEGHFSARNPWVSYHELLTGATARLVGALPHEVVVMNTLSVNLHLLMVSFYRPRRGKHRLLIEQGAFPSDRYAVASQARFHGFPDAVLESEDPLETLRERDDIALALIGNVNYLTGRAYDMRALVRAAPQGRSADGIPRAPAAAARRRDPHAGKARFDADRAAPPAGHRRGAEEPGRRGRLASAGHRPDHACSALQLLRGRATPLRADRRVGRCLISPSSERVPSGPCSRSRLRGGATTSTCTSAALTCAASTSRPAARSISPSPPAGCTRCTRWSSTTTCCAKRCRCWGG